MFASLFRTKFNKKRAAIFGALTNEIVRKMVIKPLTVSGKRHAKSSLFGVAFDQPDSNSEAF